MRYHADRPAVIRYLSQVLDPLTAPDDPGPDAEVVDIRILGPDDDLGLTTHAVWVGDQVIGRPSGDRGVAAMLLWDLNRLAITLGPPRLSLHAGAAVRGSGAGRRIAVLPAPPDSGKSTLTLGLVRSGLAYVGDEAFGLALDDQRVIPYLKPLTLDPGSWSLFPELEPRYDDETSEFVHGKWHLDVRGVGGGVADDIGALGLEEGAPTQVERLPASELAVALAENAFNLAACGQSGVAVLAGLAASAEGWRLVSGDLDDAVAAVRDLLGRTSPKPPRAVGASSRQTSIRAGSHASATAARAETPLSIQTLSILATQTGSEPSSGKACLTPPPVSSACGRSSDMAMAGGPLRARTWASRRSAK